MRNLSFFRSVFNTQLSLMVYILFIGILLVSCNTENNRSARSNDKPYVKLSPNFNTDSAYYFVEKQVAFGSRVPNTKPHEACGKWLAEKLASFGADTLVQRAKVRAFTGDSLRISNIIGQFGTEKTQRIMLMAHWDTRPFADQCTDSVKAQIAIPGANDGAGAVGVLLEIARVIGEKTPDVGVDIFLFDAEDYGEPNSYDMDSWCLGSAYWAQNKMPENYTAKFGILLDMVSGKDVFFTKESHSMHFAPQLLNKVWIIGEKLGYQKHFSFIQTHFVGTDDHVQVNRFAKIPSIALIHYNKNKNGFANYWHTHNDNMNAVSKESLVVSGQTVLEVIYTQ